MLLRGSDNPERKESRRLSFVSCSVINREPHGNSSGILGMATATAITTPRLWILQGGNKGSQSFRKLWMATAKSRKNPHPHEFGLFRRGRVYAL